MPLWPCTYHSKLTVSPRQSNAPPPSATPSTLLHRKFVSHSTGPSTSRSQQSVESLSPPHTIFASRRPRVTLPSPSLEMFGKKGLKDDLENNPAHWRLVYPEFVNKEDWDGILASWMTEKWRKRSAAAGIANRKKFQGMKKDRMLDTLEGVSALKYTVHAGYRYRDIVKKKNGVDDIVSIPFDDEARAVATYFTKTNKGYGFGLTKQAQRIFTKAKRSALKRSRAYTLRIIDEAWIESEVTTRLESGMKAFELEMKQRVEEQVQLQVQQQIKKFLARNSWLGCKFKLQISLIKQVKQFLAGWVAAKSISILGWAG
nr:hypothetical protein [Tanacetum cinerariifolium]